MAEKVSTSWQSRDRTKEEQQIGTLCRFAGPLLVSRETSSIVVVSVIRPFPFPIGPSVSPESPDHSARHTGRIAGVVPCREWGDWFYHIHRYVFFEYRQSGSDGSRPGISSCERIYIINVTSATRTLEQAREPFWSGTVRGTATYPRASSTRDANTFTTPSRRWCWSMS